MKTGYEESTFSVEEYHWWYRGRRRIIGELMQQAQIERIHTILHVGCGSGRNMQLLAGYGERKQYEER